MNELTKFWKGFTATKAPYVHPADRKHLEEANSHQLRLNKEPIYLTETFYDGQLKEKDRTKLQLGLLPNPYMGDLDKSKVFIFMLNPGFSLADFQEQRISRLREAIVANIQQDRNNKDFQDFPYICLHPDDIFASSVGGKYIQQEQGKEKGIQKGKLWDCVKELAQSKGSINDSLKILANNVCLIESLPYHSSKYNFNNNLLKQLPSHQAAIRFINEKAEVESNLIFVVRWNKDIECDLPKKENVIWFTHPEGRSGYFTLQKHGGRLVQFLLADIYK